MHKRFVQLAAGVAAVLSIAACSEKIEGGAACPLLCPEQAITLRDTVIDAVDADTTVPGLPPIGSEQFLMLSSHGDTLETRAIIRFDTLPQNFTDNGNDSAITHVDSAYLITPLATVDSAHRPNFPITIEAYDVDTTATDTVSSILGSLFRHDRLLGTLTIPADSLKDTVQIPLSIDSVKFRVDSAKRLRVGLRVVASQGVDLRIGTTTNGLPVTLKMVVSTDSTATQPTVTPLSSTPADQPFLAGPLADYTIVLKGTTATPSTLLAVGGVPSRRSFLRFNVPSRIVDSTTVVRASLLLTQAPNRRVDPHDSVFVYPLAVLAQPAVTDVATLLQFLGPSGQFGLDSLNLAPADSGVRSFEVVGLVRTWKNQPTNVSPRAIALRSGSEGAVPAEIDFFSTRAPASVRPRLRITFVPQTPYGLP